MHVDTMKDHNSNMQAAGSAETQGCETESNTEIWGSGIQLF